MERIDEFEREGGIVELDNKFPPCKFIVGYY